MTFGEITRTVLFEKENYGALFQVLNALHDFYSGITGISAEHTTDNNIHLATGKAISPGQAAHCLVDIERTAVFTRGVYKAILKLKSEVPGPINILYAGCGPYATLLTPLTTQFSPEEVRFYLLDVNEASLTAVKKLYQHLNATNYVAEFIHADAATYRIDQPVHLVISETMQRALAKEPQVAIMQNLIPQLSEQAVFIPEEIIITAQFVNRAKEVQAKLEPGFDPGRVELGEVYRIGRANCCNQSPVELQLPDLIVGNDELCLYTEVRVFEDEWLKPNSCALTIPFPVSEVSALLGKRLRFEYEISGQPGFRWAVLENSLENWPR